MSWQAVDWALGQQAPSSAAKLLLVVLGNRAGVGDCLAWPSAADLSEITQQDRKTVLKNLKSLEDAGLIHDTGKKVGRTGQVTVWRLPVDAHTHTHTHNEPKSGTVPEEGSGTKSGTLEGQSDPKSGTLSGGETVPVFPPNSTAFPSEQYQKRDTEPVMNPKGTRESTRAGKSPGRKQPATRLPQGFAVSPQVQAWAEKHGHRQLDAHLEHFIGKARAKGYTYLDWDQAFMNAVREDWAKVRQGSTGGRTVLDADEMFKDCR